MATIYTDIPHNIEELAPYIITDKRKIISKMFQKSKCFFYDTCSFRRHANLPDDRAKYLMKYIILHDGIVIITRCILMELASHSGNLNHEYIDYIKKLQEYGIDVLVMYEEDVFSIMEVCFSTNEAINQYLCWAVRTVKSQVSTITETLERNVNLKNEVLIGKNIDNSGIYAHFFNAVRSNKETGDNLGEEMIAICLHILSNIPGEENGKFCVITEDKGAAGKLYMASKNVMLHNGNKIEIFSTPKLVQFMHREGIISDRDHIKEILVQGVSGNVSVLGTLSGDIYSEEISISVDELATLIMKPNAISISF